MKFYNKIMTIILLGVLFTSMTSVNFVTASTDRSVSRTVVSPDVFLNGSSTLYANITFLGTTSYSSDALTPSYTTADYEVYDYQSDAHATPLILKFDVDGYLTASTGEKIYGMVYIIYDGVVTQMSSFDAINNTGYPIIVEYGVTPVTVMYLVFDDTGAAQYAMDTIIVRTYETTAFTDAPTYTDYDFNLAVNDIGGSTYENDYAAFGFNSVYVNESSMTFTDVYGTHPVQTSVFSDELGYEAKVDLTGYSTKIQNATSQSPAGSTGVTGFTMIVDDFGLLPSTATQVRVGSTDDRYLGLVFFSPRGLYNASELPGGIVALGTDADFYSGVGFASVGLAYEFGSPADVAIATPDNLTASLSDANILTFTWNTVTLGDGVDIVDTFIVYRGTAEDSLSEYKTLNTTKLVDDLSGLEESTTYYYQVQANSSVYGLSEKSPVLKVTITIEKASPFNAFAGLFALFVAIPVIRKFRK